MLLEIVTRVDLPPVAGSVMNDVVRNVVPPSVRPVWPSGGPAPGEENGRPIWLTIWANEFKTSPPTWGFGGLPRAPGGPAPAHDRRWMRIGAGPCCERWSTGSSSSSSSSSSSGNASSGSESLSMPPRRRNGGPSPDESLPPSSSSAMSLGSFSLVTCV